MKKYLAPYRSGSMGCKVLAEALGVKRIKTDGSKFRGSQDKLVINWGRSSLPDQVLCCNVLNMPASVGRASNKLSSFQSFTRWNEAGNEVTLNFPEWTTDEAVAQGWLDEKAIVVSRTVLCGHSGNGIVISTQDTGITRAPLYVKYVKKSQEYRVHVVHGEVVDMQRKARDTGVPDEQVNWQVRNHENGFIFMREGVDLPAVALQQATAAVAALDLDFGAVDLIYNDKKDTYFVLEVNTAPGLTGTTLEKYKDAFARY